jgi:hypothetical protein
LYDFFKFLRKRKQFVKMSNKITILFYISFCSNCSMRGYLMLSETLTEKKNENFNVWCDITWRPENEPVNRINLFYYCSGHKRLVIFEFQVGGKCCKFHFCGRINFKYQIFHPKIILNFQV